MLLLGCHRLCVIAVGLLHGVASFNAAKPLRNSKNSHHVVVGKVVLLESKSRGTHLSMSRKYRGNRSDEDSDLFLPLAGSAVLFVAFWPLLALLRDTNDPTAGFDIDMFMSLKGILESAPQDNLDILELPPLSPGERLVEAIFGLPST
jgi:hypothetical protein